MIPVYKGVRHQYGYGLGSLFKSALRTVTPLIKPMVKSGLHALKDEGIKQGLGIAQDILLHRKNPKKVLKSRGKQSLKTLTKKLLSSINKKESIKPPQFHSRSHRGKITSKKHRIHRKAARPIDIFD